MFEPVIKNEEWELIQAERDALVAKYAAKGIVVSASFNKGISDIELPFTNDEWVDLLDTEGEFLPACCGNISEVRDHLFSAIRNGRMISSRDLRQCYELLIGHGCEDDHEDEENPINRLIKLWLAVADDVVVDTKDITFNSEELHGPVKSAIFTISSVIHNFIFPSRDKDQKVCEAYSTYRIVPALKLLCSELEKEYPDTAEGFALCQGDVVCKTCSGIGLAIYGDEDTADNVCKHWNEHLEEEPAVVRPVKISVKNGITFLENK